MHGRWGFDSKKRFFKTAEPEKPRKSRGQRCTLLADGQEAGTLKLAVNGK